MSDDFVAICVALIGLIVGSFLNVCIHRLPGREPLVSPSSHCPHCRHALGGRDLIPLFSYLWLKGRCRYCGHGITCRYPVAEALTGLLFAGLYLRLGLSVLLVKYLFLTAVLIVVSFIDLEHYLIPDRVILFALAGGVITDFVTRDLTLTSALLGLALPAAFLLVLALITRDGMGAGDVKLAAATGLFLGWPQSGLALFFACLAGGLLAIVLLALKIKSRKEAIPFGPFLAAGALMSVFWGQAVVSWYVSRFLMAG